MPSLEQHQSNEFTKLLLIGDSKSGKTGSLVSLVSAGYKLRILDYDNGLDVLAQYVRRDCPDKLGNVEFRTLRDPRTATPLGSIVSGKPSAFVDGLKMLDRWKYGDVDLGVPAEWGRDCVLVIDSLTFMSDAAFDWREPLVQKSRDGKYDGRAVYRDAQSAVADVFATITSETFRTNVVLIAHIRYVENQEGLRKGYPNAVGSALSPLIPRWFNNIVRYKNVAGVRKIETVSSAEFDLATAKPFTMPKEVPIETGLADIFAHLRNEPQPKPTNPTKPNIRRI